MKVHVAVLMLFCFHLASCSRILVVFPHVGKSHHDVYSPYLRKLASHGHQLMVISHFPQEILHPNMTDISIKGSVPMPPIQSISFDHVTSIGSLKNAFLLSHMARMHCENILALPQIREVLTLKFDLVITELFNTDCFLSLVHFVNAPFIYFSSSVLMPWANDRIGNPDNPSYIPNLFLSYSDKMSFIERLSNTFDTVVDNWFLYPWYFNRPGQQIAEKSLGQALPPLQEIARQGSLILVNSHFSLNRPRPLVPSIVEVGGIHIDKSPSVLSQDLQDYLDSAEHGVIYFSMGSMLRADTLPVEKREAFVQAFSQLQQKVLWKWEGTTLPGQPKNVKIAKWLPQFDILNHPNVRVFLAHGGLLGTIEAVHTGVPMVGIPMYGDQNTNMKMVESAGMAIALQYSEISEETVLRSLRTVLDNTSYMENARKLSRIFKDRPMSPMDTAIFWTEYVIRHHGAPHMRTAGADLPLYQYLLLDVIAVLIVAISTVIYMLYRIIKKITGLCRGSKDTEQKKKKKQ